MRLDPSIVPPWMLEKVGSSGNKRVKRSMGQKKNKKNAQAIINEEYLAHTHLSVASIL